MRFKLIANARHSIRPRVTGKLIFTFLNPSCSIVRNYPDFLLFFLLCLSENQDEISYFFSKVFSGKFIRSIIGLDASAAKDAFAKVLQNHNFNTQQIRFIDTIISFLTVNGTIETSMLFAPPFTDINPGSIISLFDNTTRDEIREVIEALDWLFCCVLAG